MSPDQDSPRDDEIRPVPPSAEQQAEHGRAMAEAMKQAKAEQGARFDKELKAMEKLNAKYAKRAEKAAAKLGLDQEAMQAELKGLSDVPEDQAEQRLREFADKYRPLRQQVLTEAGIDAAALSEETMSTVDLPEHAKAVGRRDRDTGADASENLGWTAEGSQS